MLKQGDIYKKTININSKIGITKLKSLPTVITNKSVYIYNYSEEAI